MSVPDPGLQAMHCYRLANQRLGKIGLMLRSSYEAKKTLFEAGERQYRCTLE